MKIGISDGLVFCGACYFFGLKDHFFLTGELVLHFLNDQAQVTRVGDKVEVVTGDCQDGTKREVVDPGLVEVIESLEVIGGDRLLVAAPAV